MREGQTEMGRTLCVCVCVCEVYVYEYVCIRVRVSVCTYECIRVYVSGIRLYPTNLFQLL